MEEKSYQIRSLLESIEKEFKKGSCEKLCDCRGEYKSIDHSRKVFVKSGECIGLVKEELIG